MSYIDSTRKSYSSPYEITVCMTKGKAVTSALLEYERTKTVNRDKMSMN